MLRSVEGTQALLNEALRELSRSLSGSHGSVFHVEYGGLGSSHPKNQGLTVLFLTIYLTLFKSEVLRTKLVCSKQVLKMKSTEKRLNKAEKPSLFSVI